MTQIPLSLYIHVPWCEKKCPYCDFNSHLARAKVDESAYVAELLRDLDADLQNFSQLPEEASEEASEESSEESAVQSIAKPLKDRPIQSVFIGGGTPSLFSAKSYQLLFDGLRQRLNFAEHAEVTLEANPGSSEVEKFAGFRNAGINRLSIGVQSFNQAHLTALGRVHNTNEALNAAAYAKQAGFDNFNLDLMFGLPEQSLSQSLDDVQQAIALNPTHLSCYQLTIEPNTLFHHSPPVTPGDELLWDMQEQLQQALAKHGYSQYEVSAYSQTDKRCQHNLNYWQFGDYLGIGAGAHGKLTQANGNVVRTWKIKHPTTYIERDNKIGGKDTINAQQIPFEFMMNALRLNNGFAVETFETRTGMSLKTIEPLLQKHQSQGLIKRTSKLIQPTQFGHNMLNNMLEDYLSLKLSYR